jgi:fumigallin biosynthesis monooxygenase-like protein
MAKVERLTPDLSEYPDLVVIYLGMQVRAWYGVKTLFGFGPRIQGAVDAQPDGLLLHEQILWSLFPPHAGMRQYWRDFDALERWARSEPHRDWWRTFLRDSGGTGFWHETYLARGGMEAVFDDVAKPVGMARFAPLRPASGGLFSARQRADRPPAPDAPLPAVLEDDLP